MARRPTQSPARPSFRLALLGAFCLERDGESLKLPRRKGEALLAYLALYPQEHAREKLAALFWGDSTDEDARRALRVALTDLRKALGPDAFLGERDTLQLDPDFPLWVDAREFKDEVRRMKDDSSFISHPSDFILYAGDLLADFHDDWIVSLREEYRDLYLNTLLAWMDRARGQCEYAQVVELGRRALVTDPANETAHQHLIFAFAAQGDRTAALEQFAACERALRDELGVAPSKETRALYESIKQTGVRESAAARLTNLPKPLTSFIGREEEIEEIKQTLAAHALVTLTGAGGAGKTRLSIELGRALVSAYGAGVWWVDLSPLADAERVPDAVAKSLGVQEKPNQPLTETIVEFLRAKPLLLVVDNCEHLVAACAALIQTLLTQCENLRVLATSREALGIVGEQVYRVPSLALPATEDAATTIREMQTAPDQLQSYAAVHLFVERARAHAAKFQLSHHNASQIVRICQRLDGIPLALELAAARTASLSVEEIANRLDDRFRLLTSGSRAALPRQQTLRALIDWSYDLLTDEERVLFRRLAVFAGGWTLEALTAIAGGADQEAQSSALPVSASFIVQAILNGLVSKSLVQVHFVGDERRYTIMETIREYAREKLNAADESARMGERHLDHFLKQAERAEPNLYGADQVQWLNRHEVENDNLRAALHTARDKGDAARLMRLCIALTQFWQERNHWSDGREWLERAIEMAQAQSDPSTEFRKCRGWVLVRAASMAALQGDNQRAQGLAEQGLAIFRELDDTRGIAAGLYQLGAWVGTCGALTHARELLEQGLALARDAHDRYLEVLCLQEIGKVTRNLGDIHAARGWLEDALTASRALGASARTATILNSLGILAGRQADYAAAQSLYEASLALYRELGKKLEAAGILSNLGLVAIYQGEYEKARQVFEAGLAQMRELNDRVHTASMLATLGDILRKQKNHALARSTLAECLALYRELGNTRGRAIALLYLACIDLVDGDVSQAERNLAEGLSLAREAKQKGAISALLHTRGHVAVVKGDYVAARADYTESIALARDAGDKWFVANCLIGLARLDALTGKIERGIELGAASENLRAGLGMRFDPIEEEIQRTTLATGRAALEPAAFDAAWARGGALTMEQAVAYALEDIK